MSSNSHSTDLIFELETQFSKTITWEPFTYDYIPCSVSEYAVTCTGPDNKWYLIESSGYVNMFNYEDSMCSFFNYEAAFTL